MATNWIKMRVDLIHDPRIDLLSELLGLEDYAVVGRLQHLWATVGDHTEDGVAVAWPIAKIDKLIACPGFADALLQVGWLTGESRNLTFPNFTEHNGATAKKRAQDSARIAQKRGCRKKCDKNATREEKSREEKSSKEVVGPAASKPAPVKWSNDGFVVCQQRRDGWAKAYPSVNIDAEINKAHAWYTDNPSKRKREHARFLGAWMRRSQDDAENRRGRTGMQSHAHRQDAYNHAEDFGGAA